MRTALLILLASVALTACGPGGLPEDEAIAQCISRCQGTSYVLESHCLGPLDDVWVCDVASNPRAPIDDIIDSQCPAYRDGSHPKFVEVTPQCELIRTG